MPTPVLEQNYVSTRPNRAPSASEWVRCLARLNPPLIVLHSCNRACRHNPAPRPTRGSAPKKSQNRLIPFHFVPPQSVNQYAQPTPVQREVPGSRASRTRGPETQPELSHPSLTTRGTPLGPAVPRLGRKSDSRHGSSATSTPTVSITCHPSSDLGIGGSDKKAKLPRVPDRATRFREDDRSAVGPRITPIRTDSSCACLASRFICENLRNLRMDSKALASGVSESPLTNHDSLGRWTFLLPPTPSSAAFDVDSSGL